MAKKPFKAPAVNKKALVDRVAHILAAIMILAPVAFFPNPFTFAYTGFCLGMIREVTEEGNPVSVEKAVDALMSSWRDLIDWTLGGALIGFLVMP